AGTLSGGQQQMVAIGRGLLAQPLLLILDEPLLGLAPALAHEVLTALRAIVGLGVTVLLVEQDAAAAMRIADRVYVLAGGEIVSEGTADSLGSTGDIHSAYLGGGGVAAETAGGEPAPGPRPATTEAAETVLAVDDVT